MHRLPDRLVENALQIPLCQRGALQVLLGLDLLCDHDGLLVLYGRHLLLPEALLGRLVVPQIELSADEDDGYTGRVMVDLRVPLVVVSRPWSRCGGCSFTFALTLSNEGGLTMEKQIKKTSVWGYESGRKRS